MMPARSGEKYSSSRMLFVFFDGIDPKKIVRLSAVIMINESGQNDHESHKAQHNHQLAGRGLLDILPRLPFADLAGAILDLTLIEKGIDLTGQANAKG